MMLINAGNVISKSIEEIKISTPIISYYTQKPSSQETYSSFHPVFNTVSTKIKAQ